MKLGKLIIFTALLMVGFTSCSDDDDNSMDQRTFTADLGSLNDSGVDGTAEITMNGNSITVNIEASGMVPSQMHPQHIHGMTDGSNSTCPSASDDTNDDGIISLEEGAPSYGPVLLPLQDFPTADENGNISYTSTFNLNNNDSFTADAFISNLENRVIVLHGLNNDGSYVATIPVACGQLSE